MAYLLETINFRTLEIQYELLKSFICYFKIINLTQFHPFDLDLILNLETYLK